MVWGSKRVFSWFESFFLPSSRLMTASPLLSAQRCQQGAGDPASLITAPEREGGPTGVNSISKEQS